MVSGLHEVTLSPSTWSVVVFAARESVQTILQTVEAIRIAAPRPNLVVDVLVNGNPELVTSLESAFDGAPSGAIRLWSIAAGDKSNAWNQYLQEIWAGEELVFFVDGYVRVWPQALRALGDAVMADGHALGGTGVPTCGRTALATTRQMLRHGGFHGNLCCVKGSAVAEMRRLGIQLPIGLYRVDSLVGALLCYGLDPKKNDWDIARVRVEEKASWDVDAKQWWRWRDLVAKYRRSVRQARGSLENAAIKEHLAIRREAPATLPRHMRAMLNSWCHANPDVLRALLRRNPLLHRALQKIPATEHWSPKDLRPSLMRLSRT